MEKENTYGEFSYDFEKSLTASLESINSLHEETVYHSNIKNSPLNETITTSIKNSKGFEIKFFLREGLHLSSIKKLKNLGLDRNLSLIQNNKSYSIDKDSITNISISLSTPQIITLHVKNLQTCENKDFDDNFLRLIIPTSIKPSFDIFDCKRLLINRSILMCGLVEVSVNNNSYHIFKYHDENQEKDYLVIDSLETNTFSEFKNITNSILIGLGLVTGNLFQNEIYYQALKRDEGTLVKETSYTKKGDSIISNISPFSPMDFASFVEELNIIQLKKYPIYLKKEVFSNICQKIHTNTTLARCVQLILEGYQTKLILLRAGIYSIALETLTQIVYEENEDKINPLADKSLAKKIRKKLKTQLNEFSSSLSEYALNILNIKIDNINTAPNSQKLAKPFELYGIKLSKSDIDILKHRNKFLHGTTPFPEDELDEKQNEIIYISSKMIFLVNCLILKYCNYSGHVIDFGAWQKCRENKTFSEMPFRLI